MMAGDDADTHRAICSPLVHRSVHASMSGEEPRSRRGRTGRRPTWQPKEIVRRYLGEIVSAGRVNPAEELVAEDLTFASPYTRELRRDRAGSVAMISGTHAAFPDFCLEEEQTLVEDDLVASRWIAGDTHTGPEFSGLPAASGRSFRITGMSIYRVRDGKIVEGWVNDDTS